MAATEAKSVCLQVTSAETSNPGISSNSPNIRRIPHAPHSWPKPPPDGPTFPSPGILDDFHSKIRYYARKRFGSHSSLPSNPATRNSTTPATTVLSPIQVSAQEVMKVVLGHSEIDSPENHGPTLDTSGRGSQPTFDDLDPYGISWEQMKKLWEMESKRLVEGVVDLEKNLSFPQLGLGEVTKSRYKTLSTIADPLLESVHICRLDYQSLYLERSPENYDSELFKAGRERLIRRAAKDTDNTSPNPKTTHEQLVKDREATFALIDYVTVALARILVNSAKGDKWVTSCLAVLTKLSTKMKVLSRDIKKSIDTAVDTANYATSAFNAKTLNANGNPNEKQKTKNESTDVEVQTITVNADRGAGDGEGAESVYTVFAPLLCSFLLAALHPIKGQGYHVPLVDTYEVCSVAYDTGLEGFKTLVFQERDGDLHATSSPQALSIARCAFEILQKTVKNLESIQHAQPQRRSIDIRGIPASNPDVGISEEPQLIRTRIQWNDILPDDHVPPLSNPTASISPSALGCTTSGGMFVLRTMEELLTIMVPLLLTNPLLLSDIPVMVEISAFSRKVPGNDKYALRPELGKFRAFFRLFTDDYAEADEHPARSDVSTLSRGLMTRDRLLGGTRLAEIESRTFREGELNTTRTLVQYREAHEIMSARLAEAGRIMNGWIYDENSVIVKCEVYVWTVMIAAIILVVGGLVIGFTVQSRIKGVDPFNITTYCWVLAAFVILVGKSVRVETWSWRDFLLRRVVCRSVSELHAVTRVPEQIILAKLLSDEDISILNTRGPFNSVFRNTANDGFSIDHPLTMWTMLLSGLIMVKVSTNQGSALVCLDVRNGTKYKWVRNGAMQTKDMYLVCPEMDRAYSRSETLPLKTRKFEWQGILGLYSNKTAKFI